MPEQETYKPEDDVTKAQVSSELDEAKQFAETQSFDEVKSGEWFVNLLRTVIRTYDRNARAEYFQQKYPGLPPDAISDKMTSVAVRDATIVGASAGAAATPSQIAILVSAGMTSPLFEGAIGVEMVHLARIQMRLVLDLSVVYELQLDLEDVLMIFGYALRAAPVEMISKGVQVAARAEATGAVRKHVSKVTLEAIEDFSRRLGFKISQQTIRKYAVPAASAAVGSTYNYATTRSVGKIAKIHLRNRGKVTEELRALVSRQSIYDLAFPAAAMYIAQVDGEFSTKEKELYRAMLSRMSFDEHTQAEFQKLIANEANILEAMAQIEDSEVRRSLIDVLILMTVYDGELAQREREFLTNVAKELNLPLDLDEVERKTQEYRVIAKRSIFERAAGVAGGAAARASGVAGHAVRGVKDTSALAGDRAKGVFGRAFKHKNDTGTEKPFNPESSTIACSSCGREVAAEFRFCPGCGQPTASEKACLSCSVSIPVGFAFCPHCGASQN